MKYTINKTNYHDFSVVEINKYPPRCYFVPYSSREKFDSVSMEEERYKSDLVTVLSGEWDFKYFDKVSNMPDAIDTDTADFDKIPVPSTWQRLGYEPPVYLNTRYEFGNMPSEYPSIPKDVSCGVYRKKFTVSELAKTYIISFLGVISSLDLYINGQYVGYSEGAHNTAEFDISKFVAEGENEIVAVVYKWSNATYLECQDMFRENGIFRDVLLTALPRTFIRDYDLKMKKTDGKYRLITAVTFQGFRKGYDVTVELSKDGKVLAAQTESAVNIDIGFGEYNRIFFMFDKLDVAEWTAETPNLYDLYITLTKNGETIEVIHNYTGFKTITINGPVYKFNGRAIKMKGVNHHDTHPEKGYVMSPADIIKDITLMKELNVNTVRTSHYPPDPFFLTMCDYYGLYVCDEADIEAHGAEEIPGNWDTLSNDLRWAPRFVDRVKRMYYRDRNHPSISMWSLGNETGAYACQDACYGFLKAECPEIPVHYEGACRSERVAYDIGSNMYPSVYDYYKNPSPDYVKRYPIMEDKPYFLCEYCHAMGVGPGALQEYMDAFYSSDKFLGGCIWEWCDHAASTYSKEFKYTYGGDHGEVRHDGNFCVDGLIYPDRTPHTGAYEMKAVYRPVVAEYYKGKEFIFTNRNCFINADKYDIKWELLENGVPCESGKLKLDIEPNDSRKTVIPFETRLAYDQEYHMNFTYFDGDLEVAKEQETLQELVREITLPEGDIFELNVDGDYADISFGNSQIRFNKENGVIEHYQIDGTEIINQTPAGAHKGIIPNIWRAFHDNDMNMCAPWKTELEQAQVVPVSFNIDINDCCVNAIADYTIKTPETELYKATLTYGIYSSGRISVKSSIIKVCDNPLLTDVPRFGVSLEMPRSFENIEYYGLGDKENLNDFKAHTTLGMYSSKVADTHEPYIFPQENGCHGEVRWLKVTNQDGNGILVCNGYNKLNFNIHHYTVALQQKARHQEELFDQNTTVLNIDGFVCGTGTSSCGPRTLDYYRIPVTNDKPLEFCFDILPVQK